MKLITIAYALPNDHLTGMVKALREANIAVKRDRYTVVAKNSKGVDVFRAIKHSNGSTWLVRGLKDLFGEV